VSDEFQFAYIIDLGGDIREYYDNKSIKIENIFPIQVGVAIAFLIKDKNYNGEKCKIKYIQPTEVEASKKEKIDYLTENKIINIPFISIVPDKKNNWIHFGNNEFNTLIPLINKDNKTEQLFSFSTLGVSTNRDEWVYDFDKHNLEEKINFFIKTYNNAVEAFKKDDTKRISTVKYMDKSIKWSDKLENELIRIKKLRFNKNLILPSFYRPFVLKHFYSEASINERLTQNHYNIFGKKLVNKNVLIGIGSYERKPFAVLAVNSIPNLNTYGDPSVFIPLYSYNEQNSQSDNITDWGLLQFQKHYNNYKISKLEIFNYVYAVLHNPPYRIKYENNLKRELPKIPLYLNFDKWSNWGEQLIQLHTEYQTVKPCKQIEIKEFDKLENPKTKLKINKTDSEIIIDENTSLLNIPSIIYDYKLGNRSAIEWILYQYKEKNPDHETIKEKFNKYKFSDYKLYVIDLILKVSTVSIETMKIIKEMEAEHE
jgi:predicted helicase